MLGYYPPIHSHALHVYESAVATMPECALFATVSADTASGTRLLSARGGWTPTLRVIEGHGGDVNSVVFAPDGTQLVSGSDDRTVRLWSVRTGGPLAVLEGHNHSVNSVAFSPDGTRVVSGSHDSTLRLWDTQSFKEIAVFRTNSGAVYAVAYSTNSLIVYGSGDGTVCVWNPPADSQTFLKGHEAEVRAVAFSPDGTRVMSGSKDGMVRLSDSRTGGKLAAPEGHHDAVKFVSFSLDGTRLVSGSVDGTIQIWDMRTSESTFILQDHIDSWFPTSVAFSPDGRQVVFGSGDSTVRVWDALLKKQLAVLSGHLASVTSVAFSPDGAELASASFDETVRVWDIQAGTEAAELQRDSLDLSDEILCSLDGLYLASTAGVQARVWDMQTFSEISRLKGHNSPVTAIAFSPDGLRIVTGADDGRVRVWDTRTGRQLAVFNGHESTVSVVAFSPDGVRIISSSDDTIRVWDVKGGEQLAQFLGHIYQRSDVAFSPDGLWIVAGSLHGAIKIWDTVTGAEIVLLGKSSGSGPATNIMFSSDGHWLHTSHGEQKLTWDFQDIVTHQGATSPREVTRDAPSHPSGIGEALGPDNTDSWTHAVLSWDHWTGWLSYILDSKISVPLCWLPMERRGPAWTVIRGWMVAVGGQGGNVTMLDLTDTIERLQNLGII
jgi:WD40 repeat protein